VCPASCERGPALICVMLGALLALPLFARASQASDISLEALSRAVAKGDTASIAVWLETHPDRVYLETVRLAQRAVQQAHLGRPEGVDHFRAAGLIAERYAARTGNAALAHLVGLYASFDAADAARYVLADSVLNEGTRFYHGGQYTEALDLFLRALDDHQGLEDRRGESIDCSRVAVVLCALGEDDRARRYADRAIEIARDLGCAALIGSGFHALGSIELSEGNLQAAIEDFRQTLQVGRSLEDNTYIAAAVGMLANAYYLSGRYHESLAMHEEALDLFRRMDHFRGVAGELVNIGLIYSTDLAQYPDATRMLEPAIEIAVRHGYQGTEIYALRSLARAQWAQNLYGDALETVSRSISLLESGTDSEQLAVALAERGGVLRDMGRTGDAEEDLTRALDVAQSGVSPFALCEILAQLALCETGLGDSHGGLGHALEAVELFEATRRRIGAEELRASALYLRTYIYEAALVPLLALHQEHPSGGHAEEAFRLAEDARSGTFFDFLAARSGPPPPDAAEKRSLLAEELSSLQLELLTLKDRTTRSDVRRRIRGIRAQLDSLEMAVHSNRAAFFRDPDFGARSIMNDLEAGETFLELFWGRESVYGWAMTSDEFRFFRVGDTDDMEGLAVVFGALLHSTEREVFDSPAAYRLAGLLLDPISDLVPAHPRLIVVTDGPLLAVPLEALPFGLIAATSIDSGERSRTFLVEHVDVSYAPSAHLWQYVTRIAETRSPAPREVLAFGDPLLEYEVAGRRWPPLVYSELELRGLDRALSPRGTCLLLGARASEDRARGELVRSHRVLHFATHAYASRLDPSASGLLLASSEDNDGFLTSPEILEMKISADLVVLSACETGCGRLVGGEGILGLSRALFYAGSTSIVASLWEVDDAHTSRFMGRLYHHLARGAGKGHALALAKREAITCREGLMCHPYFWAPFVMLGDSRRVLDLTTRRWHERAIVWPLSGIALSALLAVGCLVRMRRNAVAAGRG